MSPFQTPGDPLVMAFKICFDAFQTSANFLVKGLGDVVAGIAHPSASRVAVRINTGIIIYDHL